MKITELELFTPNLEEQTSFYSEVLEFSIVESSSDSVSFKVGASVLKLTYREKTTPYHYAINIPANKEKEALEWLKQRVEVLTFEGNEIQYFDFWDAKAIYFYDKDKNIGEFIARRTLKNDSTEPFDVNSLVEISEIGIPTNDIARDYESIKNKSGLPIFSGSLERFASVGDENGLFIMINKEIKKEWFPTSDEPFSSDFSIQFSEGDKSYTLEYEKEKISFIA